MPRMPGRNRASGKGSCGLGACHRCRSGDETRRFKRAVRREFAGYAAELPDPAILDAYDEVVPDGRRRLLVMRSQSPSWEEVGAALAAAMRQVYRELRHETPDGP